MRRSGAAGRNGRRRGRLATRQDLRCLHRDWPGRGRLGCGPGASAGRMRQHLVQRARGLRRPSGEQRIVWRPVPGGRRLPGLAHMPERHLRPVLRVRMPCRSTVQLGHVAEARPVLVECGVRSRELLPGRELHAHPGLHRVLQRLHDLRDEQSVQRGRGLRGAGVSGVHGEWPVRAERSLSGNSQRYAVHVLSGHRLFLRRNVPVGSLRLERNTRLREWASGKRMPDGASLHQRDVRPLHDIRGLQRPSVRHSDATGWLGLRRRRLCSVLDQRAVRRRDGVRRRHVWDVLHERPVRPDGSVHRWLLHLLERFPMRVGAALRLGSLRRDVVQRPRRPGEAGCAVQWECRCPPCAPLWG